MKKAQAGFTLIELVIVIIIVAILAAASVPIYRNYVRRAVAAEGTAMAGSVLAAARVYFTEHQGAVAIVPMPFTAAQDMALPQPNLGVNPSSNRYFKTFTVTAMTRNAGLWTISGNATTTEAEYGNLGVTFSQTENGNPDIRVINQ